MNSKIPGDDSRLDGERILDHTRMQLSALVDGELAPDEAAFLMRRLRHDDDLAGCWERWQLAGELLRGRGGARLPDGFGSRVMAAVAAEPPVAAAVRRTRRWLGWGGGAIAASVALVALLMTRQAGQPQSPAPPAHAPVLASSAAPATRVPARKPVPAPAVPDTAAQLAGAAVAVAEVPRRIAGARRGNAQAQRAATRVRDRGQAPRVEVASAAAAVANPFSPEHALPATRPWPRSLVPGLPATGAFTVDYGGLAPQSPSLHPFAPRAMPLQRAEPEPDVAP